MCANTCNKVSVAAALPQHPLGQNKMLQSLANALLLLLLLLNYDFS
jgi:hypothetical protein